MPPNLYMVLQVVTAVLLFIAASHAGRARNGQLLARGLQILAVEAVGWAAINFLGSTGAIEFDGGYERIAAVIRVIGFAGLLVLVAGASRLAGGGQSAPLLRLATPRSTYLQPADTSMESLVIPRNSTNSFARAEELRDQLYARIEQECARAGLNVVGYKSASQSGTVWVRFDYLLPQDTENLSLRASLRIAIERYDYHRFEHLYTLEVIHGTKSRTRTGFMELTDSDLQALNGYLSRGGSFPSLSSPRVRSWPLQLWRPLNKVDRLRPDWIAIVAISGVVVLVLVPYGPLLAAAGAVLFWLYQRGRQTFILTTGKPVHDPRELVRMDSWQATIDRLAPRHQELRMALSDRVRASASSGIVVRPEQIWYPGVDGKVEREQIVCSFRRAIGFLHLEPYGNDLYVGWDTHVNCGTWVEQTLARGVDRQTGKLVVANRVVPGWQAPNEYDITDVNYLTEWLHATVVRVVKLKMEEHRIDQELDFTVQRESRKQALATEQPAGAPARPGLGGLASRLRRTA